MTEGIIGQNERLELTDKALPGLIVLKMQVKSSVSI
jgi:hypothetical protein